MKLNRKSSLALISLIIIIGQFFCSEIEFVNAYHITDYLEDVFRVVNDEFDKSQAINQHNQSSIDFISLTTNSTSSQIILSFVGEPVIDPYHGYRVIIDWDKELRYWLIEKWPNVTWEKVITTNLNFTVCYAGGVSGLGIANGSYSEFYNSSGSLLYSEVNNNTVVAANNSIIFSVNQTLIPNAQLNTRDPSLGIITYNAIIFTNYNTTETTANSTTITNVVWMDSLPEAIIVEQLFMLATLDTISLRLTAAASTIALLGVCKVIFIKRRRKRRIFS